MPAYDIRTDRFEVALDAMDSITASHLAKREKRITDKEAKIVEMNSKKDDKIEPTQGKN